MILERVSIVIMAPGCHVCEPDKFLSPVFDALQAKHADRRPSSNEALSPLFMLLYRSVAVKKCKVAVWRGVVAGFGKYLQCLFWPRGEEKWPLCAGLQHYFLVRHSSGPHFWI